MYILIISIIVFAAALWYWRKNEHPTGVDFVLAISATAMLASVVLLTAAPYEYEALSSERTAIKITHIDLRMAGHEAEIYCYGSNVLEWNTKMYQMQKLNGFWLTGQFIDDRVDELEPLQLPR